MQVSKEKQECHERATRNYQRTREQSPEQLGIVTKMHVEEHDYHKLHLAQGQQRGKEHPRGGEGGKVVDPDFADRDEGQDYRDLPVNRPAWTRVLMARGGFLGGCQSGMAL